MNGAGRSSYIFGPSEDNHRIEKIWREVQKVVGSVYQDIFSQLEQDFGLNVNNQLHLFALHYVYLPRLKQDLEHFRRHWNRHGIITERYQTPRQLFMIGMMQRGFNGVYFNPDTDTPCLRPPPIIEGPECVNHHDVGPDESDIDPAQLLHVNLEDPRNPLDEEQMVALKRRIDPLDYDASPTGIELYIRTISFLLGRNL
ncbi:hypothetical protein BKA69DRAFT_1027468 [Paraphysoderma sedebokerense]|nr:hypothetical protein BKA69DRAFT_1027468 [Paraphysoderma sedebokerense]